MTASTACSERYLYAIIAADAQVPADLVGLEGPVRTIGHRQLAAVVGDLPSRPLGNRADLMAHDQVVAALARETSVVPARFGGAVASAEVIVDEILEPHHDQLVATLGKLKGLHQFTLRADYESDAALRSVAAADTEIRRLREEILRLGENRSYSQRIRQGELIVQGLQRLRAADSEQIRTALSPFAVSISEQEPARPDEVIHMSFLVADSRKREFESAVEQIGRSQAERMRLRLLGPLAPYDFVPKV